jgi:pimeloyl-ACP methyl ester carboxylesterase
MPQDPLAFSHLDVRIDGVSVRLATMRREGPRPPAVFLHGFGSTKEDYADLAFQPAFAGRAVLAYDAPGCGETVCSDLTAVSIPFLVEAAEAVLRQAGIARFHLVGHSMGGLTALMLADRAPSRVLSFVDIEGNVAPEDCFLSRQILTHPADDPEQFLAAFIDRVRVAPSHGSALYAASLPHRVRAGAVGGIFRSLVELSDHGDLLTRFLALPFPRMFMYGDENAGLTYLPTLAAGGVELAEIPRSGHFPMYSNPVAMWSRIGDFQDRADAAT